MSGNKDALRVDFDGRIRLEFHGTNVTSDAGLLVYRELDEALGLADMVDKLSLQESVYLGLIRLFVSYSLSTNSDRPSMRDMTSLVGTSCHVSA